jgi:hypothetical protein
MTARTKVGDVFSVPIGSGIKKYIQYVADDLTQLNSPVIRAFRDSYPLDASPDLLDVVRGNVDFYAHVVLKWGIQMKLWERAGNVPFTGELAALFRDSDDYGNPAVKVSHHWRVWKAGEDDQYIGKLEGDYRMAEIGVVVNPPSVVTRLRTGKYDFAYPGYS